MIRKTFLAAVGSLALLASTASAKDITLKITQVFPETHWHYTEGIKPFVDMVTAATGGKVKIQVYNAGQLGKESTKLVSGGLAEMGLLVPGYETEKLPLTAVVELPGFHKTSCEGTHQFWEMAKPGGPLYKAEYSKLGIRPLYVMVLPPYEVQTNTKVIESVADMKGVKLRANGVMAQAVAALGGVPVQVTSNEFYDALKRGTVDGGMWLSGSTRLVGLEDVLHNTVKGTAMGAGSTFFAINEKVYESLPADVQKALTDAGEKITERMCHYLDDSGAQEEKWLVDHGNLHLHQLPPAEAAKWQSLIEPVADKWAEDMDKTGRAGSEMLKDYRAIAKSIDK